MTKAIRVGLVGSKYAARLHWDGIRRVYGVPVKVVGVTSKTADARDAFAREKGIRSFESFEEMCASVDVVDLCTPPSSHEHLAVRALEQGKHVIIEKPLTGYFDSGAQDFRGNSFPKETMLREALASCARSLTQPRQAAGASAMRKTGSTRRGAEGARDPGQEWRPDPVDAGRAVPQWIAFCVLRLLAIQWRRIAGGQGVPPAEYRAVSKESGRPNTRWGCNSPRHGKCANPRNHSTARLSRCGVLADGVRRC